MRLLSLFSKPRNDEFWGILEFISTEILGSSPRMTQNTQVGEFL